MKKTIFLLTVILLTGIPLYAQKDTTERKQVNSIFDTYHCTGWYAGFSIASAELNHQKALLPGLEGGAIFDQRLAVGLRFVGFTGKHHELYDSYYNNGEGAYIEGGYGGLNIEPMLFGNNAVHFSFPMLFGVGGISYTSSDEYLEIDDDGEIDYGRRLLETDLFWAFEPGISIEINLTHFMKISVGTSYRMFSNTYISDTPLDAFNGLNGKISLKIGKF